MSDDNVVDLQGCSIKTLNKIFGISADIKASNFHISMDSGVDGEWLVLRMAVSFSWYSMKLDKHADDKLATLTPKTFSACHYPPCPEFGRLYGGEIEYVKSEPIVKMHKDPKTLPSKLLSKCPDKMMQYRIKSWYNLKKPMNVLGENLPIDIYSFKFEVDLEPTTIYRLTPSFATTGPGLDAITDEETRKMTIKALGLAADEANGLPLNYMAPGNEVDKSKWGGIDAYHIAPEESGIKDITKKAYKNLAQEKVAGLAKVSKFHNLIKQAILAGKITAKKHKANEPPPIKPDPRWANPELFPVGSVSLKKVQFQPILKHAMGKKWMTPQDVKKEDAKKWEKGEKMQKYNPKGIKESMQGFDVLLRARSHNYWPTLKLREEHSEESFITRVDQPSENSVAINIHIMRSYVGTALTVQVPLWLMMSAVPFGWDFFFEDRAGAYSYLATLLLSVVAHRSVIDSYTEKIQGVSTFDREYAGVLLVILLTMVAMLVANKLELSEEIVQVYILYGQLGATGLYILLRVSRIFMIFLATGDTHGDVSAKFVMLAIRGRRNLKVSASGYVRGATHNGAVEPMPKQKTVTINVAPEVGF
jgi:hypothetical protein